MKIPTLFKEYIWLIETTNQAGKITFTEINERWKRHRDAILDMFGVIIERDRKDRYRYFIYNREVLEEDSEQATSSPPLYFIPQR